MSLRQTTPIDRIDHELAVMARQIAVMRRELSAMRSTEDADQPTKIRALINPSTGKKFQIRKRGK